MRNWFILLSLTLILGFSACKETYTPKPHGYLRIELPTEHNYTPTPEGIAFKSSFSSIAQWVKLEQKHIDNRESQWYNIYYPNYNAKVHLSYITINDNLDSLLEESHKFVFEHTVRAEAIDESTFHNNRDNVHGVIFNLQGNSASNMEFWATDSMEHFLRGALYFEITPNVDSLYPVINYIKEDITHFVENISWSCP